MISQQYEMVRAHQAWLRREAAQDRLAREVFERSPPRLSVLVDTVRSVLAWPLPRVSRREQRPVVTDMAG